MRRVTAFPAPRRILFLLLAALAFADQPALGNILNGQITMSGLGPGAALEGCARTQTAGGDAKGSHPFALTFEGDSDSHLFVARGSARGVAMRLQDSNGHVILPGASRLEYMPPSGDTTLRYLLSLQGTGQALKAGNYQITVRLRMHYF